MTSSKNEHDELREILRRAYRDKENVEVGDQWQDEVMSRIRDLGDIEEKPSPLVMFEQFVWRLAPLTCLLIIGLTVLLSTFDFTSGDDVMQVLMNGTEDITLNQFFEL